MRYGLSVLVIGVGLLGLVAVPARACPGGPRGEELAAKRAELFAQADADGDGALDAQEFGQFHTLVRETMQQARFDRIDTDDDGLVSADELESAPARHWRRGRGRGPR